MHELRDYQANCNDNLIPDAIRRGKRKIVLKSPCGSGKTTIIADLCKRAASKGSTVTVTAHRRRLIKQIAERLNSYGVTYTVEMADLPDEPWVKHDESAEVVIGSMQTMLAKIESAGVRKSKIVIPDEAHTINAPGYRRLLGTIKAEYLLGFTATPCQDDGSGFGPNVFDEQVEVIRIEQLIERKLLTPVEAFAPVGVGKRRRKGLKAGISGDPVKEWIDHAYGLRGITFCRTLAECRTVRDMFLADSIPARHIDAKTEDTERDEAFAMLESGEIKVLVCTPSLMGVGVDLPFLEYGQTLTKGDSPRAHWQSVGRIQRMFEGKMGAVWLDHAGAIYVHGDPNTSPDWPLSDKDSIQQITSDRHQKNPAMKPQVCPACGCYAVGATTCPKCQTLLVIKKKAELITERERLAPVGDLSGPTVNPAWQKAWRSMLYTGAARGMKCAAVAGMFKGKFGVWPSAAGVHPVPGFQDNQRIIGEVFPQFIRRSS